MEVDRDGYRGCEEHGEEKEEEREEQWDEEEWERIISVEQAMKQQYEKDRRGEIEGRMDTGVERDVSTEQSIPMVNAF